MIYMDMNFSTGCKSILLMVILSSVASANAASSNEQQPASILSRLQTMITSSGVVTLSVGPIWESAGDTQTLTLAPNIEKTYAANHARHTVMEGELFLGIQKPLSEKFNGQIGLAIVTTGNANLSGNIWDDADPQFNNYTYRYNIKHTHLALKGKLIMDGGYAVKPWISASVGLGFNTAHDFTNTPLISQAIAMPDFVSHTTKTFTYTIGVGLERNFNQHWQVGLGYEFADWGKSQLSAGSGQTLSRALALSHLYTNGVLFGLSYLA